MNDPIRLVNLSLQIWSSLFILIIIICLISTKKYKSKGEKLYVFLLLINMLTLLMDACAFYFRGKTGSLAFFAVRATNYLSFALGNLLPLMFFVYFIEYIEGSNSIKINKLYIKIVTVVTFVIELSLIINLFFPFYYKIDAENIYQRLDYFPIIFIESFDLLIITLIILFTNRKKIRPIVFACFLIYVLIPVISIFLSLLIYGITFSYLGTALSLSIMFFYLQLEREQISKIQDVTEEVAQLKDFEKLVNKGIKLSMEAEDPDENIKTMLNYVGNMFSCSGIHILEKNKDFNIISYIWPFNKEKTCYLDLNSLFDKSNELFKTNNIISLSNIDLIKADESLYNALKSIDINSIIVFPFWQNRILKGFISFENPINDVFDINDDVFEIIGSFFVSLFKKRDLIKKLQDLSYTDAATGCRNRLAMYQYFNTIKNEKNIGVVFCDITGLKETNDTRGHSAGDSLIQTTYGCLLQGFNYENIFRIGGDEFVILIKNISESDFNRQIEKVKDSFNKNEIVVALGSQWRKWAAETVNLTISDAEKKMYHEKSNWYVSQNKEKRLR